MPLLRPLAAAALAASALAPAAADAAPPRADLAVTSVRLGVAQVTAGATLAVTDVTANRGGRRVASTRTTFLLSTDRRRSRDDVALGTGRVAEALAARRRSRAVTSLTVPAGTRAARYFVLVCADGTRNIRERREGDNCRASAPLTVVNAPAAAAALPVTAAPPPTPLPLTNDVALPKPPLGSLKDDVPNWFYLEPVTVVEGETARVTVEIVPAREAAPLTVAWSTLDGTAAAPADYAASSGVLTFAPDQQTATIEVPTVADGPGEDDETFTVLLDRGWDPHGPGQREADVTITD